VWKASATTSGARSGTSSVRTRLAVVPNQEPGSNSWNDSRPRSATGTRPTNSTSGVASCHAVCSAIMALAAPGPRVTMATPTAPLRRASAIAMKPAPPSWRHTTVAILLSCSASSTSR
jgi:hypothetical protein